MVRRNTDQQGSSTPVMLQRLAILGNQWAIAAASAPLQDKGVFQLPKRVFRIHIPSRSYEVPECGAEAIAVSLDAIRIY